MCAERTDDDLTPYFRALGSNPDVDDAFAVIIMHRVSQTPFIMMSWSISRCVVYDSKPHREAAILCTVYHISRLPVKHIMA